MSAAAEYLAAMGEDFAKVVDSLKKELTSIRTGRASPQLLDSVHVFVASYGSSMPVNQLASVSAPDARLIVVNPWDKSTTPDIERAILNAGLGLNPSSDGQVIRVPIPALTGERRQDLVRTCKKMVEEHRVRARHVRREYNDLLRGLEADKDITEDESRKAQDDVQKATDECIAVLDRIGEQKEKEVLEV